MMATGFLVAAILWGETPAAAGAADSPTLDTYGEFFTTAWRTGRSRCRSCSSRSGCCRSARFAAAGTGRAVRRRLRSRRSSPCRVLHALLCAIMLLLHVWARNPDTGLWHAFVWAPALVLFAFSLTIVVLIGMMGRQSTEGVREWWSRLGAWLGIYGVAWMIIAVVAVYGPQWVYMGRSRTSVDVAVGRGRLGRHRRRRPVRRQLRLDRRRRAHSRAPEDAARDGGRRGGRAVRVHRRPADRRLDGPRSDHHAQLDGQTWSSVARQPCGPVAVPDGLAGGAGPRAWPLCSSWRLASTSTSSASTRSTATAWCAVISAPRAFGPASASRRTSPASTTTTICALAELAAGKPLDGPAAHRQLRAEPGRLERSGAAHPAQRLVHADARCIAAAATSRATQTGEATELGYVPTESLRRQGRRADARPGDFGVRRGGQPEHGLSHVAGRRVPADRVQRAARLVVPEPGEVRARSSRRRTSTCATCSRSCSAARTTSRSS